MTTIIDHLGRLIRSPAFKFILISFLILLLGIPLVLVALLVYERQERSRAVEAEIASIWGGPQQMTGPFVVVPYTVKVETTTQQGARSEQIQERRAIFVPEILDIKSEARTEVLHRSIFDVTVYKAEVTIGGRFGALEIAEVVANPESVRWRDATLVMSLAEVAGLKDVATATLNETETLPFAPSLGVPGSTQNGIHVRLAAARQLYVTPDAAPTPFTFQFKLSFSGSTSLSFAPAARETRVAMTSDWPSPSFSGAFLPNDRSVRPDGFSAAWKVPHLARSVPNAWSLNEFGPERFYPYQFGVTFYQPVEFYDLVFRATKYALLFIASAFMAMFVLELLSARRVHPVQYLFAGLALVFFYVLLLSLAEHTGFLAAYLAASAATGGMLSLYLGKALASARGGWLMLAMFGALFGLLYLILRLEDYALLAGALLGFTMLTLVMFATLRVDWSGEAREARA